MTGYNWENNFSNAGQDYLHQSDNYLPWVMGLPANQYLQPGVVATAFHDSSLAKGTYSLITLPMAGYVAKDGNGPVTVADAAPSARWAKVVNQKGSAFSLKPDTSDNFVYIDEFLNLLINKYGKSSSATGIKGYALDNEPSLWSSTHPRIHPVQTTITELLAKSVALASVVKGMDSTAEVFGPVLYGFNAYLSLQNATDWTTYRLKYAWFVDCYLDSLSKASANAKRRLLDAFDVHWYPDVTGVNSTDTTKSVAQTRMQVTRSLWDSSYVESSWIGQYHSPVAIICRLQNSINKFYPGTKLAITEYEYGADNHISGAIAEADALGIFGRYNIYFASLWGDAVNFVKSAFEIYRNYDGKNSAYGNLNVPATTSDIPNSSVYSSLSTVDSTKLHIIVINKNYDNTINGQFTVNSITDYKSGVIYGMTAASSDIRKVAGINTISSNKLTYSIPPLSIYHFILSSQPASGIKERDELPTAFALAQNYPNPFNPATAISFSLAKPGLVTLKIYDMRGAEIQTLVNREMSAGAHSVTFNAGTLASGVYFYKLISGEQMLARKMILTK